jgi:hypothetical protein
MRLIGSCFVAIAVLGCADVTPEHADGKPEIVEIYACSDYCPGPDEKYMKRVYDGVSDQAECERLGGKPYTYVGWSEFTVCLAE